MSDGLEKVTNLQPQLSLSDKAADRLRGLEGYYNELTNRISQAESTMRQLVQERERAAGAILELRKLLDVEPRTPAATDAKA